MSTLVHGPRPVQIQVLNTGVGALQDVGSESPMIVGMLASMGVGVLLFAVVEATAVEIQLDSGVRVNDPGGAAANGLCGHCNGLV